MKRKNSDDNKSTSKGAKKQRKQKVEDEIEEMPDESLDALMDLGLLDEDDDEEEETNEEHEIDDNPVNAKELMDEFLDDESEDLENEEGEEEKNDEKEDQNDQNETNPKSHKISRREKRMLFKPPTNEELQQLKKTDQLFKSNLFRLEIIEMLQQVSVKQTKFSILETYLQNLKQILEKMSEKEVNTKISSNSFSNFFIPKKTKIRLRYRKANKFMRISQKI